MISNIYLRVDGNSTIGLGHVFRCLAIAQMLDMYKIHFVCKEIEATTKKLIESYSFLLTEIRSESEFLGMLNCNDIVIIDHYELGTTYQMSIKAKGCKLVCIDDLHSREFYADLIINPAPGISEDHYKAQPYTKFALGPNYALLRPMFLQNKAVKRLNGEIEHVFICFGGSDPKNLTLKITEIACKVQSFSKIYIVTGPAYIFQDTLKEIVESDRRISYVHSASESQIVEFMLDSDLAVVPSSGVLFEALALGCDVISSYYIDNQRGIYEGMKKLNAGVFLESFDNLDVIRFEQCLVKFKTCTYRKIIDGLSVLRIQTLINEL